MCTARLSWLLEQAPVTSLRQAGNIGDGNRQSSLDVYCELLWLSVQTAASMGSSATSFLQYRQLSPGGCWICRHGSLMEAPW